MPTIKTPYINVPNCSNVKAVSLNESHNSVTAQATVDCYSTTLSLGDSTTINMGYTGDNGKVFTGYVREIRKNLPDANTQIILEDELSKANDYFMAAANPDNPFSRSNISTEDLVEDILNEASITNFTASLPLSVTWGTFGPIEINLVSAWAAASSIADMMAWKIYADRNGQVHLEDRKPYVMTGETADFDFDVSDEDILSIDYTRSSENLRNRIVVYGLNNISATASAVSPFLPSGFFKTSVIATPFLDTQGNCQKAADFNLELFNRLTERLTLSIEGDWNVAPRKIATVTEGFTGVSGDWYIYAVESRIDRSGYIQNLVLTR